MHRLPTFRTPDDSLSESKRMTSETLIIGCRKGQRQAQRAVYERLSPRFFHLCRRYLKHDEEIEEALADAFYTIFTKIEQLKENAAFDAWARRIVVNQCLLTIRKKVNFNMYLDDVGRSQQPLTEASTELEEQDLLNLLQQLPEGCRTIFNLFVIEGYAHKEIAAMLQVSEGTSKSQLNVAKTKLRELLAQIYYPKAR